jgi:hypothetical protein
MNKSGVSAVVATVLIILITVAAVGIIWVAVVPLVRDKVASSDTCLSADLFIDSSAGWSCHDPDQNLTKIRVKRGSSDAEIVGIEFYFDKSGNTKKFIENISLGKNGAKVYSFSDVEAVDKVRIAPIVKIGETEEVCGISSSVQINTCKIVSDVTPEDDPEPTLYNIPLEGLISWWKFEGTADDSVGDNHGLNNGGAFVDSGKIEKGLEFGDGDNVNFGSDSSLDNLAPFTALAWIKPSGWGGGDWGRVFDKRQDGTNMGWTLHLGVMGTAHFTRDGENGQGNGDYFNAKTPNGSILLNEWQHIVVEYQNGNSGGVKIYINGVDKILTELSTSTTNFADDYVKDLILGNRKPSAGIDRAFYGIIDEVMIYNRSLNATEIGDIYLNQS